jgi:hypothetical protein
LGSITVGQFNTFWDQDLVDDMDNTVLGDAVSELGNM